MNSHRRASALRPPGLLPPVRLVRRFSLLSLACILVVAVLMTALYRVVTVSAIVQFGQRSNLTLAQSALLPIQPQLIGYLDRVADVGPGQMAQHSIDPSIQAMLAKLMANTSVVRVKIYTRRAVVAFSTNPGQIGSDLSDNDGVTTALAGGVASELVYRDAFNPFDKATEEDNLIQTYLPVRDTIAQVPHGVFEIYTDVNAMVDRVQRAEWLVLGASMVVLSLLYVALLLIVRRGAATIDEQQRTIGTRTRTLEELSAQMLSAQEAEKRRLADRLHEGISQNLAAIKMLAEKELAEAPPQVDPLREELVELIHETVDEVTGLAVGLHPPSLDHFGLVKTLKALPRECMTHYPHLRIEAHVEVEDVEVPPALKVTIYRVAQESLEAIGQEGSARRAELILSRQGESIELAVADDGPAYHVATGGDRAESPLRAAAREHTVLSGGSFEVASDQHGGTVCRSLWQPTEEIH